jgi:PTH1 family peptidyl-tRNA hydrolase
MLLIAGLGNPGQQYADTRHNVGFAAVDHLQHCFNFSWTKATKFNAEVANGTFNSHKILLAKPLSYMNLSGNSLQSICSYYKIPVSDLIVIHDDIDLTLGSVKLKLAGSSGGHNGLKSIDSNLGNNYLRIRIGVGRPLNANIDVADYVLGNFSKDEEGKIDHALKLIADNFDLIFNKKFEEFKKKAASN